MANRYYSPSADRVHLVEKLFTHIAPRYDFINDLQSLGLHRHWKRLLLDKLDLTPGLIVADLCCGSGDLALGAKQKGCQVIGLDYTFAMLQQAQARSGAQSKPIPWLRGDALHLPLHDTSVDRVCIGYGLRNLQSLPPALEEIYRILKPGGRAAFLEFSKPPRGWWRSVYFCYLKLFSPLLGRMIIRDAEAYRYILESLENYPEGYEVTRLMQLAGFNTVKESRILGGIMSLHVVDK